MHILQHHTHPPKHTPTPTPAQLQTLQKHHHTHTQSHTPNPTPNHPINILKPTPTHPKATPIRQHYCPITAKQNYNLLKQYFKTTIPIVTNIKRLGQIQKTLLTRFSARYTKHTHSASGMHQTNGDEIVQRKQHNRDDI